MNYPNAQKYSGWYDGFDRLLTINGWANLTGITRAVFDHHLRVKGRTVEYVLEHHRKKKILTEAGVLRKRVGIKRGWEEYCGRLQTQIIHR